VSRLLETLGLLGVAGLGVGALAAALHTSRRRGARGPFVVLGDSIAVGTAQALERAGVLALSRARSGEGIGAFEDQLQSRLVGAPQTTIVSIGTNSLGGDVAELAVRVQAAVRAVRATGRRAIVLGPPPARDAAAFREDPDVLWRWAVLVDRIADHVDLWELLGDPSHPGRYADGLGAPDLLHPSRTGYDRIARAILEGER